MAKRKHAARVVADEDQEPTEAEIDAAQSELDEAEGLADNARDVPLFADVDGRTSRSIAKLKILKFEPGGPPAYKGMFPTTTTLDTIGQLFGDGTYTIEGLNHRNTPLAVKENVRIALGMTTAAQDSTALAATGEADRIERLARQAAAESKENSSSLIQFMTTMTQAASEREARAYAASQEAQSRFFASMLAQSQQMFHQTVTMLAAQSDVTIRQLQAANERDDKRRALPKDGGSETKLVEMLLRGMKMGRDLSSGDEKDKKPMWADIMQSGFSVLANVQQQTGGASVPMPQPNALPPPTSASVRVLSPTAKNKIRKALRFYELVRSKGIDPEDMAARLLEAEAPAPAPAHVSPDEPDDDEQDDESDDDEQDEPEEDDGSDVLDDEGDADDDLEDEDDEEDGAESDESGHAVA